MPDFGKGYYNPFYNEVDESTINDLNKRANYYSKRVRNSLDTDAIEWSYRKMAYGHVLAKDPASKKRLEMGFPSGTTTKMTDNNGKLTLYESTRNLPKFPLLQSIDVTNDGTVGSLLRGKFNFVYWPEYNGNSFNMGIIDDLLFVPGKEARIAWGWSVEPGAASRQAFSGIINNFNWSYNIDHSINAEVSVVSAATISIGISGDQVKSETDPQSVTTDPAGVAMKGINIASIIASDLATITGSAQYIMGGAGQVNSILAPQTNNKLFDYVCIGWPLADETTGTKSIQTYWYTTVTRFVDVTNKLIDEFERSGGAQGLGSIFEVIVDGNCTAHMPNIQSSYPQDVIFPSQAMGSYGRISPAEWPRNFFGFHPPERFNAAGVKTPITQINGKPINPQNLINIGGILLSVNLIKETYLNFIEENAANIPYRNITKLYEDILKKINVASGDMYQISAVMCDNPEQMLAKNSSLNRVIAGTSGRSIERTILSIEDTNISQEHINAIIPYKFTATALKPLIKNINISSKPPGPLAAAAFTKARGSQNANNDTPVSENKRQGEPTATITEIQTHAASFESNGFNDKWSETARGLQSRLKKVATQGPDAHWLTRAIYPVELSITIDGVSGFTFGNVITTSLLPTEYRTKDTNMVFTITKIDHKIVPHSWETTLHTVCRLDAKAKLGSPG